MFVNLVVIIVLVVDWVLTSHQQLRSYGDGLYFVMYLVVLCIYRKIELKPCGKCINDVACRILLYKLISEDSLCANIK